MKMTEDEVRLKAHSILQFDKEEPDVQQGTGQVTTLKEFGFSSNLKPDGWYLPTKNNSGCIVCEFKNSGKDITNDQAIDDSGIKDYMDVVASRYATVIGILYNGTDLVVFKQSGTGEKKEFEKLGNEVSPELQNKEYYKELYMPKLDKQKIYQLTKQINDCMHFKFGMTNLNHRMLFTACALAGEFFNRNIRGQKGNKYETLITWIKSVYQTKLNENQDNINYSDKIKILDKQLDSVTCSITNNQEAIDLFIDNVAEIAEMIERSDWNGEDVMSIFFNEFNRYKGKSDAGQVFTPDHAASFMYRLIECNKDSKILDATCGSGTFLVKAMSYMIHEAGGCKTKKAEKIRREQLFGIELYEEVLALACANMLIHKDGMSNLAKLDTQSKEAGEWIKSKGITKVLMNPPYERKYGCLKIVENVLDNVEAGTLCAFIMPDKKLEKDNGLKLLKKHTLQKVIKMPEELFAGVGITTSIFVFKAGTAQIVDKTTINQEGKKETIQVNTSDIVAYYIEDDGLVTVKNQGRQDIHDKWPELEDYWIKAIATGEDTRYNTKQIINPLEHLSYQMPEAEIEINMEQFNASTIHKRFFEQNTDVKELKESVANYNLYNNGEE